MTLSNDSIFVAYGGKEIQNAGIIFMPYIDDLNLQTTLKERTIMKMKMILEFMNKHRGLFDTKIRCDFRNKYQLVRKQQGAMDSEIVELVDKYSKKIEELQSIYSESK